MAVVIAQGRLRRVSLGDLPNNDELFNVLHKTDMAVRFSVSEELPGVDVYTRYIDCIVWIKDSCILTSTLLLDINNQWLLFLKEIPGAATGFTWTTLHDLKRANKTPPSVSVDPLSNPIVATTKDSWIITGSIYLKCNVGDDLSRHMRLQYKVVDGQVSIAVKLNTRYKNLSSETYWITTWEEINEYRKEINKTLQLPMGDIIPADLQVVLYELDSLFRNGITDSVIKMDIRERVDLHNGSQSEL